MIAARSDLYSSADGSLEADVAIGITCYDRPTGLQRTIDCLRAQTHTNWRALIGDNASPNPEVKAVADRACETDPRFNYLRRERNIGAEGNFRDLAERASGAYFMWASDDDLWEPDFIETCLGLLDKWPAAAMAFGNVDNINRDGQLIRSFPGFSRFQSCPTLEAAGEFLRDPEIMGKANLIYSLFRMGPLKAAIESFWEPAGFSQWGGDMVFLYGYRCRYPFALTDRVLLHKRIDTESADEIVLRHAKSYFVPRMDYESYVRRHMAVAPSREFAELARTSLRRRFWESRFFTYLAKWRLVHMFA